MMNRVKTVCDKESFNQESRDVRRELKELKRFGYDKKKSVKFYNEEDKRLS
jgi:hypothetical protein